MSASRLDIGLLRDIAAALKRDVTAKQNVIKAIEQATSSKRSPIQPLVILPLVRRLEPFIGSLDEKLSSSYLSLRQDLEQMLERYLHRYNAHLRELCDKKGWHCSGEYPEYQIEGFVKVRVDGAKLEARVNSPKTNNVTVEEIGSLVEGELKRLLERPFDKDNFLRTLFEAYHLAGHLQAVRMGQPFTRERYESVHLKEQVFPQFVVMVQSKSFQRAPQQAQFKDYPLEFFSVDLSRLLFESPGGHTYKGYRFQFEKVRRPEDSIYVYNRKDKQNDYFGLIRLVPAEQARSAD